MHPRPIGPKAHGIIDYGFAALNALAPSLLGLRGPARAICYGLAASQGVVTALTDTPVGVKRLIPFRVHGELETPVIPSILLLPMVTGAMRQKNARLYFLSMFAVAAANYALTDYNVGHRLSPLPSGQRAMAWAEEELARV